MHTNRLADIVEHEDASEPKRGGEMRRDGFAMFAQRRDLVSDADRELVGELRKPRCLAHADGHDRIEFLPDAGHRAENRGRYLAHVLWHGLGVLNEIEPRSR